MMKVIMPKKTYLDKQSAYDWVLHAWLLPNELIVKSHATLESLDQIKDTEHRYPV